MTRTLLVLFQLAVAISAILAGLAMMINPNGINLGVSIEVLNGTPFKNFFFPGLFLLIINGIGQCTGVIFTIRRKKLAGQIAVFLGILLMLWIFIQIYLIGYESILQPLYFLIGAIEVWLGNNLKNIKT